jgi:hypothetical protein
MPYEGEILRECPGRMFDFSRAYAVVVSGDDLIPYVFRNKWGHTLLNTGGPGGYYFQTGGPWPYDFPRMMNEAQFHRYLEEHAKIIVTVFRVNIPYPEKSQLRLEQLLAGKRWWLGVVHNCESLVEEIVVAGGGPRLHQGYLSLPMNSTSQCAPW